MQVANWRVRNGLVLVHHAVRHFHCRAGNGSEESKKGGDDANVPHAHLQNLTVLRDHGY